MLCISSRRVYCWFNVVSFMSIVRLMRVHAYTLVHHLVYYGNICIYDKSPIWWKIWLYFVISINRNIQLYFNRITTVTNDSELFMTFTDVPHVTLNYHWNTLSHVLQSARDTKCLYFVFIYLLDTVLLSKSFTDNPHELCNMQSKHYISMVRICMWQLHLYML